MNNDFISRRTVCEKIGELIKEWREQDEDDLADAAILIRRYVINRVPVVDTFTLLKTQEPLPPVIVTGEYECGECRYELRRDADSYCPCCGRKVKWE